jgi:hypothetical protein
MANTQPPQTGSLEQILRCLQAVALSPAYGVELGVLVGNMNPGPTLGLFRDTVGGTFNLDISDKLDGGPAAWLGKLDAATAPGFATVTITDELKLLPPFPVLQLVAQPGKPQLGIGGVAEDIGFRGWSYTVDAVAIAHVDADPQSAQRGAMVMIDAFEALVEINESLGGLVQLISATGPPQATSRQDPKGGFAGFAMVRFEARVKRASGL